LRFAREIGRNKNQNCFECCRVNIGRRQLFPSGEYGFEEIVT